MQIVTWPGVCVIEVPNRWTCETSERVISIFRPDGTGVVQVELFSSTSPRELIGQELHVLPGTVKDAAVLEAASVGVTEGLVTAHEHDGRRWRIWAAQSRERSVKFVWFATGADDAERGIVDKLIASFRWQ